jgi:hypothetical protein
MSNTLVSWGNVTIGNALPWHHRADAVLLGIGCRRQTQPLVGTPAMMTVSARYAVNMVANNVEKKCSHTAL